MHFDALCLACIRDELADACVPGRVQQLLLAGPRSLGLEIYARRARHALLLSAEPDDPRLHRVEGKLRRGVEGETPLLLLLRKYVRDALLTAVQQPDPTERVLELHFEQRAHGPTVLVVELLGRAGNLILRRAGDEGAILECLVRVPPGERTRRVLLPGRPYTPPPLAPRLSPLAAGAPDQAERLAQIVAAPGPLWKALVARASGIGPTQAREIAFRVAGSPEAPAAAAEPDRLRAALTALWAPVQTGDWTPGVWRDDTGAVGYSPVATQAFPFTPTETLSAAIEQAVSARGAPGAPGAQPSSPPAARDPYAGQRQAAAALLQRVQARIERQLAALAGDEPAPGAADALRRQAEWLLALHHRLQPGDTELVISAEETGDAPLVIPLDPARDPVTQAQRCFKQAAKMERAATIIPARRAHLHNDLAYLRDLECDLALAQGQPEIAAVRRALVEAGLLPATGTPRARPERTGGPRRFTTSGGALVLVGRNAAQNDRLTFETARPDDLWLHVRGAPGSHTLLQARGGPPSAADLLAAAQLAAYFSSLRGEGAVDVVVTERRHVSRPPGARPGQVLVRKERTVRVPAALPETARES